MHFFHEIITDFEELNNIDLLPAEKSIRTIAERGPFTSLFTILNKTNKTLLMHWIDRDGVIQFKTSINPGEFALPHSSREGAAFRISDANSSEILNYFVVPKELGLLIVE